MTVPAAIDDEPTGPILVPRRGLPVRVVVSGGQTGADRAALDAARLIGLPIAGFCPLGRVAEDGPIPAEYPLEETSTANPGQRTSMNVRLSTATILLHFEPLLLTGGSRLTQRSCEKHEKPLMLVRLHPQRSAGDEVIAGVLSWLRKHQVQSLNVVGPRESKAEGIYDAALEFLCSVLGREVSDEDRQDQPPVVEQPLIWAPTGVR